MTKTLKHITVAEVETLQKLSIETFSDTFKDQNSAQDLADYLKTAYDLSKLTAELNDPNSQFYFAYLDGQLAGYLKLNLNEAQSEQVAPNALEIERIYIRSACKRHGLGRFLFQEALKLAQEENFITIWRGVLEKNDTALAFYEKMGFTHHGSHSFFMGADEQTDLIMVKNI
ncbi:MAG: GNAT family N-acetyltransferase [Ligilactobacillus sp.]|nr:GNAT family N-acetyltransferase [Ligilactobacillus sp.]